MGFVDVETQRTFWTLTCCWILSIHVKYICKFAM